MPAWDHLHKWLMTAVGGTIATLAGGYLLHVFLQPQTTPPVASVRADETARADPVPPARQTGGYLVERPALSETPIQTPAPEPAAETLEPVAPRPAGGPKLLSPAAPVLFSEIDTLVSVSFRETLGSRYAEFVVDAPGSESFRFPARSAGAAQEFETGGRRFEIRVVAIDWQGMTSQVMLRPAAGS